MVSEFMSDADFNEWLDRNKHNTDKLTAFNAQQLYKQAISCDKMEKHLETLNGTVEKLKENQIAIQRNQENLHSRIWGGLPSWIQKTIIVWLFISIIGALAIPILCAVAVQALMN